MMSIRTKLLSSLLAVVFIVTVLLALVTYFSIRREMDEFYDENLKQVAHTILNLGTTGHPASQNPAEIDEALRGEEEYLTQVWNKGILQYSSHPHVDFPLQQADGQGQTIYMADSWRFYRQSSGDIIVQLSQGFKERHSVMMEIYGFLLIPILIQFPIFAVLIYMLISYGLKPLNDISTLIKNRNPSFLEPLPNEKIPVELTILVSELNNLLARLKHALQSQRRFTADAAHELRTPLTAVRLQLDILKRAGNAQETKSALSTLEKGVLRSTHLVQQLLELERQEPENIQVNFGKTDLTRIVEECTEQVAPLAHTKHITITPRFSIHPIITGDASALRIMIGNLINNAVTYTNHNGHVDITVRHDKDTIILHIADDGIGIPVAERHRIFDRFYRVAGTGTTGSGLGLSIVRSIADLHKATISVTEGINGQGTAFQIVFRQDS